MDIDKIEHYSFGFVLTLFALINPYFIYLGIIFAYGKEVHDHFYGTGWNSRDLFATIIGVWVGFLFLLVIFR